MTSFTPEKDRDADVPLFFNKDRSIRIAHATFDDIYHGVVTWLFGRNGIEINGILGVRFQLGKLNDLVSHQLVAIAIFEVEPGVQCFGAVIMDRPLDIKLLAGFVTCIVIRPAVDGLAGISRITRAAATTTATR